MGLNLNINANVRAARGGGFPTADLSTYHKTITDNIFAESIENLPAKFLPRVADFNGTDDVVKFFGSSIVLNDFDITIDFITGSDFTIERNIIGVADPGVSRIYIINNKLAVELDLNDDVVIFNEELSINTHYVARFVKTGTSCELTLNEGTPDTMTFPTGTGTLTITRTGFGSREFLGKLISLIIKDGIGAEKLHVIFTGQGNYEYDLSGNNFHGTWSGTGTRYDYDLNGSLYANENGYSLWQKSGSPDIQVPFDINGNALSLIAGVNIPTGYTKTRDIVAGGSKWNMADALVGFNEDAAADTELEIFDRSNTTRQTATSRASIYYDDTDLAKKSRYHISEIADILIYNTFFETAYQDKVFGKVIFDGTDLIRYDEELNYGIQQSGYDLQKILKYCNLLSLGLYIFSNTIINNSQVIDNLTRISW